MIPAFSAAGVIPPFMGDPAALGHRSPYAAGVREVVERFATSPKRCEILRGWLGHREALHSLGLVDGFQWLDGSFCERRGRDPNDIDLVTFVVGPTGVDLRRLTAANREVFSPRLTKMRYLCDAYFVQLHDAGFAEPGVVIYWYSLFSHRRDDLAWKGILQVPLAPTDDADAINALTLASAALRSPVAHDPGHQARISHRRESDPGEPRRDAARGQRARADGL